jgi:hypothetical protein
MKKAKSQMPNAKKELPRLTVPLIMSLRRWLAFFPVIWSLAPGVWSFPG